MAEEILQQDKKREQDMTKGKPMSMIVRFVIPLFIGNMFQQLYSMVDSIIVGHFVGVKALGAVGSTGTIMFLILGFATGLTTGFTVLCAQRFGAKDFRGLRQSVANAILLSIVSTVVITWLAVLCMNPLLKIMNTPADIYQDAYNYIIVITWGTFTIVFYNLFSAFLRAVGNSKIPLVFLILSAILNVFLDLLFIIVFKMGTAGAAFATDIAQGISAVLCLLYIYIKLPILRPKREEWHFYRNETASQLRVGVPMALQFAITASGTMIMQTAINLFGSTAVAAFTAGSKLVNLITQAFPSLGQAMATYCGQNYGKKDVHRIREGIKAGIWISLVFALLGALVGVLLVKPSLHIFFAANTNLAQMLPWTRTYVYLCILFFIPLGLIFIFRNAMQGCGYGLLPMIGGVVELFSRLTVALIAMKIMSYPMACFCDPAAWITTGIFTMVCCHFVLKKVEKRFQ